MLRTPLSLVYQRLGQGESFQHRQNENKVDLTVEMRVCGGHRQALVRLQFSNGRQPALTDSVRCLDKGRGRLPLIFQDYWLGSSSCLKDTEGSVAEAVGPGAMLRAVLKLL